jgi:hypothetical protein
VPPLVRRYLKTSVVFLALGLLLGAWIVVGEVVLSAASASSLARPCSSSTCGRGSACRPPAR